MTGTDEGTNAGGPGGIGGFNHHQKKKSVLHNDLNLVSRHDRNRSSNTFGSM